jgi:hypothetical protein
MTAVVGILNKQEIKQGMTPEEISEVVSDRLIAVVKEQFE